MANKKFSISPRGELVGFVAIQTPATNYNADGVFQANLAMDPKGSPVQKLIDELERVRDEFAEEKKEELKPADRRKLKIKDVFVSEEDEDTGEETGRVIFRFKQNHVIRYKKKGEEREFKKTVKVVDSKGTVIKKNIKIGKGTEGKVAYEAIPYYNAKDKEIGITLRMDSFKVLKLVQYLGGDQGNPFEDDEEDMDDEDAFSVDDLPEDEDEDEDDETSEDGDDSEDELDDEIPF